MSASTEKKLRAQAKAAGTDKRSIAAAEEAKKKAKTNRRIFWACFGVAVFIILVLVLNSNLLYRNTTAVTVGSRSFSPAQMSYEYAAQYSNFYSSYGSYASLFGLDTSYGLSGLSSQECSMGENMTWKDYFIQQAEASLQQLVALADYAEANGITLTEDELAELEENYESLEEYAVTYGYADGDRFLAANYGKGVNIAVARTMDTLSSLASKAYTAYVDSLEITDEEVAEAYPSVAVRHILIKAEADENGEYTDEALAAAKEKAEEILAQWQEGDATEESFAALAEEYSEDEGSNTNGGLYENILERNTVEEFNAFCFEEDHDSGDTAIVYGDNGSYAGYHVMYFVGEGDPATNETGRSYIESEKATAWLEELIEGIEVKESFFMRLVGKTV